MLYPIQSQETFTINFNAQKADFLEQFESIIKNGKISNQLHLGSCFLEKREDDDSISLSKDYMDSSGSKFKVNVHAILHQNDDVLNIETTLKARKFKLSELNGLAFFTKTFIAIAAILIIKYFIYLALTDSSSYIYVLIASLLRLFYQRYSTMNTTKDAIKSVKEELNKEYKIAYTRIRNR